MKALFLASKSPRRTQLLSEAGIDHSPISSEVSEILDKNLNLEDQLRTLATDKAKSALGAIKLSKTNGFLVLGADTVAWFEGEILGKPRDFEEACLTLRRLSGKRHTIYTAVSLVEEGGQTLSTFVEATDVVFKTLSDFQIDAYCKTGSPLDKAASYGIQDEYVVQHFIEAIYGSKTNVIGLPMERLQAELQRLNFLKWDKVTESYRGFLDSIGSKASLVAVSKLQPLEKILHLYQLGQRQFGENYVQELLLKKQQTSHLQDIHWHLIGPLQSNKVKDVVGSVELIQSVDRASLADKISALAVSKGLKQSVLMQVNYFAEPSKAGYSLDQLQEEWSRLGKLPGLSLEGVMVMPPLFESPEQAKLAASGAIADLKLRIPELQSRIVSYGTSADFKESIEAGSTMVRIGTSLFGERNR